MYLRKKCVKGESPPETIAEFQVQWFYQYTYSQVYGFISEASDDLKRESNGTIQFRYNVWEDKWRFHDGSNDYLALLHFPGPQIKARMNTQEVDLGFGKELHPIIEDEIYFTQTPILAVKGATIRKIKPQ